MSSRVYIKSSIDVKKLCNVIDSLNEDDYISLDTEFKRDGSLHPKLALIQLKIKDIIYLVDGYTPTLDKILLSLNLTKSYILAFSCSEDIYILAKKSFDYNLSSIIFKRCYDIQLMASFCNHSYKKSLAYYVKEICNVELEKACTRSNWLKRPLTEEQLEYACDDVEYLKDIYDFFLSKISKKNLAYFQDEMNICMQEYIKFKENLDEAYKSVGGNFVLNDKPLKRLYYICKERYKYASKRDLALNHVITTKSLWSIAKSCPHNLDDLEKCNVNKGCIKGNGYLILKWVRESIDFSNKSNIKLEPCYDFLTHREGYQNMYNKLDSYIKKIALKEGISTEILSVKKDIHEFFYYQVYKKKTKPILMRGWRYHILGDLSSYIDTNIVKE